eukprot:scaffold470_cov257-Pinguiococcus_pyrenoidosus.AAC.30
MKRSQSAIDEYLCRHPDGGRKGSSKGLLQPKYRPYHVGQSAFLLAGASCNEAQGTNETSDHTG